MEAERHVLTENDSMLEVIKANGTTLSNPIARTWLRTIARKRISDTALLDRFLNHKSGKVTPAGSEQLWRSFIAGGIAGAASRTATAPLDRLKVVLQMQTTRTSVMSVISTISREEGLLGFFRGNGLNVMKAVPETAIKFYAYEMLKNVIGERQHENGEIGTASRLVAGGMAGAVAQAAIYPLDLLKTRMQIPLSCRSLKAPKLIILAADILIQEGPLAFYRGMVPSLIGITFYTGIDLTAYETLKDMSKKYVVDDTEPAPLIQLGCGIVSGTLAATFVYPFQLIRTRLQARPFNPYKGMSAAFCKTLRNEGFRGLYIGLVTNLLKVVPAASITYMIYETTKKNLDLDLN